MRMTSGLFSFFFIFFSCCCSCALLLRHLTLLCVSPSLCPVRLLLLQSFPFLSIPLLSARVQAWGPPAERRPPGSSRVAACSPLSLFFLLEVEHHQGVRFTAINCCLIPKKTARAHALMLDVEGKKKKKKHHG